MRLLFVYVEFLNQNGEKEPYRGFPHLSVNFSTDRSFSYKDGSLTVEQLDRPLPPDFFGERIYNVTTFVGDNGVGKTTILHYLINLLQQFYKGKYSGNDRGLIVVEDGEKTYVLEFNKTRPLPLMSIPKECEYTSIKNRKNLFSHTKLIYLSNTLTHSDLKLVREQPVKKNAQSIKSYHFRYDFLYNCSTSSLMVENCQNDSIKQLQSAQEYLDCFFSYEQYKQIKYVFDKQQHAILKELREKKYPVPVPDKLIIELQCEDFSAIFGERVNNFQGKFTCDQTKHEQFNRFVNELCWSCIGSFFKTVMLYLKEDYRDRFLKILKEHISWKEIHKTNYEFQKWMFLEILHHILDAFYKSLYRYENVDLIRNLCQNCIKFIDFIFDEKDYLKQYFEMEPLSEKTDEKEQQTISFSIKTTGNAAAWFITFLQKYRYTCEPYYYLNFYWGLSSGEQNLLRLFSSLYYIFDSDYTNPTHGDYRIYNGNTSRKKQCDSILLMLDEADLTYHPEWQRRFISILAAFLPKIYPDTCCRNLQIILTTHSPLMLGDSPAQSVVYLREENGCVVVDDSGKYQTFGENLYMLLQNSFGVQNSAIGELVQIKIQEILRTLKIIDQKIPTCADKKEVTVKDLHTYYHRLQKCKEGTVAFLADGIIKTKLGIEIDQHLQKIDQCLHQLESQMLPIENERICSFDKFTDEQLQWQLEIISNELEHRKEENQ